MDPWRQSRFAPGTPLATASSGPLAAHRMEDRGGAGIYLEWAAVDRAGESGDGEPVGEFVGDLPNRARSGIVEPEVRVKRSASLLALLGLILLLSLTACAPRAGRGVISFYAEPGEVIATLAREGPLLATPDPYDYFSIEEIGNSFITLRAEPSWSLFFLDTHALRMRVTVFDHAGVSSVAVHTIPSSDSNDISIVRSDDELMFARIIGLLDQHFDRAPNVGVP